MPLDVESIRALYPGRKIVWLDRCPSTMAEAARLAAEGAASLTVVGAEEQSAGHGRLGRAWHSEREAGLYLSFVLRVKLPEQSPGVLSLALGLATVEAIERATEVRCDLRWPNDVMFAEKKCGGILVQLIDQPAYIAGIGINVNQTSFPPEVSGAATSLRLASGRDQSRERLCFHLLGAVASFTKMLEEAGADPILRMFARNSSYAQGKRVIVHQVEPPIQGVTDGLDPNGFLWVRQDNGDRIRLMAGGVRAMEA